MRRILLTLTFAFCLLSLTLTAARTSAKPNVAALEGASQNDYWGALAYSSYTGRYGFAYDYRTQADAINAAVNKCRARDCQGVVWFHNGCGAFARGRGAWGWGIGNNRAEAESKALVECRKHGGYCRVIEWACTTR